MKKKYLVLLIAILLVSLIFAGISCKEETATEEVIEETTEGVESVQEEEATEETLEEPVQSVTWKFSMFDATGTDYYNAFRAMWDRIEEETGGEVKVEIYPLGQLGGEADLIQGMQTGTLDAAQMAVSLFGGIEPAFKVEALPFIFNDFDHADRFMQTDEAKEMNASLEDDGLLVWYWSILGFRQPNLIKGPINSPEDFKGLKWRTMEVEMQIDTMAALGATPIPLPYDEVYNALKMGVVDAWMNDAVAFKNLSTFEVAPYHTDMPLFSSSQACVISKASFDALSEKSQEIVKAVVQEESPGVVKAAWDQNRAQLQELIDNEFKESTKVVDVAPYLELVQPVYDKLLQEYPETKKYIDAINRVR